MAIPSTSPAALSPLANGHFAKARNLTEALDLLTLQAQGELGNVTQTIFFMGDGLQRAVTDGVFNLFRPQTWTPNNLLRISSQAVQQTIQLSRLLRPDQAELAWQELRNKLEVFILVKNLSSVLRLPADQLLPLPALVERAYTVPAFEALWAVEGLGHYYTDMYWELRGVPQNLLSEEQAAVPAKSLLMLHAGMGLAFAERLLRELTSQASDEQVRYAVEYFFALCRSNSRSGYLGAAVESLGLVTRDFYPDLVGRVERQVRQNAPEFLGYFWHGVGRAIYFSREYFLPILRTVWSGIDEEAYDAPDRLSAMAGLSWAVTLVNMRQPAIMENVVQSHRENSDLVAGFINGVVSSIIMRVDTTPGAEFVSAFYEHRIDPRDRRLAAIWEQRIAYPVTTALQKYYPVLQRQQLLGQIFRYQDLDALVSSLQDQNITDTGRYAQA